MVFLDPIEKSVDSMGVRPASVLVANLAEQKLLVSERRAGSGGLDGGWQIGVRQLAREGLLAVDFWNQLGVIAHGVPCSVFMHDNFLYHA